MKKLILFALALFFSLSLVHAAEFYQVYEANFSDDIPSELFVSGGECQDVSCTAFKNQNVEVFNEDAIFCLNSVLNGSLGVNAFETCISKEKETSSIVQINESDARHFFVTKVQLPASFGHLVYFSTKGDTYLVKGDRITNYNCSFDICIDSDLPKLDFIKKNGAIAEIQQVNIVNTENPAKPIQIEVPIDIDETVCSAFQFSHPEFARVSIPQGFSDFSANTIVSLEISKTGTTEFLFEDAITLPIQADLCAGLAAFNFTADSSLQNQDLTFRVETDVSDRQVINAQKDFFETTETVFPLNLDGACFVRGFDFTLSNTPNFGLTSSTAQITQGESLFAGFRAIGLRDNALNPIPFRAEVFLGNQRLFTQNFAALDELQEVFINLSSVSKDLPVGTQELTLVLSPQSTTPCTIQENVVQVQNLEVQEKETFSVNFFLRDRNASVVPNANVTLFIVNDLDFFVEETEFEESRLSNTQGFARFDAVPPGDFIFVITAENFTFTSGNLRVASNTDLFITLDNENLAPVVLLPDELRGDFRSELKLESRKFIFDPNDAIEGLNLSARVVQGEPLTIETDGINFFFTTDKAGQSVVEVTARDSDGAQTSDTMLVTFINDLAPVVQVFEANPSSGAAPFETEFVISLDDENVNGLICTLDFGDGTSLRNNCNLLNGVEHLYNLAGTFVATLTVEDGVNFPVTAQENVFVFNNIDEFPVINSFELVSSNGIFVPTNLSLSWDVSHTGNFPMTCELIINDALRVVNCVDSLDILNFDKLGVSTFTLRAIDNQSFKVEKTITQRFRPIPQALANIGAELSIDQEILGNTLNFQITVDNEKEVKRQVEVQPRIVCDGSVNIIKNDKGGFIATSLRSRAESPAEGVFEFSVEKKDFKLLIPKDKTCTFELLLKDEFGEEINLSKQVIFRSADEDSGKVASIRGHGSDILSYMISAIREIKPGFNVMSFKLENHHEEGKEFTITITSRELGIDTTIVEKIGSDEEREVQIPLFIDKRYKAGMYPVRISVNDEEQRQTRYTYIKIGE